MGRTYRWSELSVKQQRASKMLAKDLRRKGWSASPAQIGKHYGAAMLWQKQGMDTAAFARLIGATPLPRWDPDIWLPRRRRPEDDVADG